MSTDRLSILHRIASGELSADEGAALLNGEPKAAAPAILPQRWLHVRVTNMDTGKTKVNVNVPFSLVQAGLKIGAAYEPQLENLDWYEILQELDGATNGKIVEVEDEEDRQRVEVYVD